MYPLSHVAGRTRIKFSDLSAYNSFIKNTQTINGVLKFEPNEKTLSVLVYYQPASAFDYVLQNMLQTYRLPNKLSRDDLSAYVTPLIGSPYMKALWLMLLFGPRIGFLQFSISSMIVNKYIKYKFE